MKIIFNADDFGITDAVSAAIAELFGRGTPLKSTSVMINLISGRSASLLKDFLRGADAGKFSIGLHFNLTCGRPVLPAVEVSSLTGPGGSFLKFGELIERTGRNELSSSHIAAEFEAQIAINWGFTRPTPTRTNTSTCCRRYLRSSAAALKSIRSKRSGSPKTFRRTNFLRARECRPKKPRVVSKAVSLKPVAFIHTPHRPRYPIPGRFWELIQSALSARRPSKKKYPDTPVRTPYANI